MIKNNTIFKLALKFPIVVLISLTCYKQYILTAGEEIILNISGYDPRDLLSGHYLIFNINYGVDNICPNPQSESTGYICFDPKMFTYDSPDKCQKFIRGTCHFHQFEAGIEKFFVPEQKASQLDRHIREGEASIVLSLTKDGQAEVKDLLIKGLPWRNSK